MVHLTSCVREPGFSLSQAKESARRIEQGCLSFGEYDDEMRPLERCDIALIVAALRAYANG
jgi:hypothetical protein